jgi:hypothetical protein
MQRNKFIRGRSASDVASGNCHKLTSLTSLVSQSESIIHSFYTIYIFVYLSGIS